MRTGTSLLAVMPVHALFFMPAQETRLIGEGKSLAIWRNLKTRVLQVGDEKKRNKDLSLRRETKRERERDNQDLS